MKQDTPVTVAWITLLSAVVVAGITILPRLLSNNTRSPTNSIPSSSSLPPLIQNQPSITVQGNAGDIYLGQRNDHRKTAISIETTIPSTTDKSRLTTNPHDSGHIQTTRRSTMEAGVESRDLISKPQLFLDGLTETENAHLRHALRASSGLATARISITKSARDDSRNVDISVTYDDNTSFRDSFNTPLDNASYQIISSIVSGRGRR